MDGRPAGDSEPDDLDREMNEPRAVAARRQRPDAVPSLVHEEGGCCTHVSVFGSGGSDGVCAPEGAHRPHQPRVVEGHHDDDVDPLLLPLGTDEHAERGGRLARRDPDGSGELHLPLPGRGFVEGADRVVTAERLRPDGVFEGGVFALERDDALAVTLAQHLGVALQHAADVVGITHDVVLR